MMSVKPHPFGMILSHDANNLAVEWIHIRKLYIDINVRIVRPVRLMIFFKTSVYVSRQCNQTLALWFNIRNFGAKF